MNIPEMIGTLKECARMHARMHAVCATKVYSYTYRGVTFVCMYAYIYISKYSIDIHTRTFTYAFVEAFVSIIKRNRYVPVSWKVPCTCKTRPVAVAEAAMNGFPDLAPPWDEIDRCRHTQSNISITRPNWLKLAISLCLLCLSAIWLMQPFLRCCRIEHTWRRTLDSSVFHDEAAPAGWDRDTMSNESGGRKAEIAEYHTKQAVIDILRMTTQRPGNCRSTAPETIMTNWAPLFTKGQRR